MYFWNTKALSEDIKNSKLSDNDWKNYFLAGSILMTLSMYLVAPSPSEDITSVLVEPILMIGILIFGISVTFNTHKASDSNITSYISKMTALAFPITIKLMTASFVAGIWFGIAEASGALPEFAQTWSIVVFSISTQIIIFWRLNVHLQSINT